METASWGEKIQLEQKIFKFIYKIQAYINKGG